MVAVLVALVGSGAAGGNSVPARRAQEAQEEVVETGFKTIRHVNRRTGGGLGAAFFALLLAIGLYLFPLCQDLIWAKLYELADQNVWKAWLYLYLLSLGAITLGYWGLSAKRTKITYSARKYGILFLAIGLVAAAAGVAQAQSLGAEPQAVYPAGLESATKLVLPNTEALIPVKFNVYSTIAILGHTPDGWKPIDAFDAYGFILVTTGIEGYDKLQIQLRQGSDVIKYYTLDLVFTEVDLIKSSASGNSCTFSLTGTADQVILDGQIQSGPAPNAVFLVQSDEPGLHLASAAEADDRGNLIMDAEEWYNPPDGSASISFVEPQDGDSVTSPFDVIVNVDWSSLFPVQEVRIGHDEHQVDNPDVVIDVVNPGNYNTTLDLPEGSHHLHAYAVDYDTIQPIGYS